MRRAFTLIELLLVVVVISLLMALLLPAVQRLREAAARAACSKNLKEIALACHAYHDDHGTLPRNGNPNHDGKSHGDRGSSCCGLTDHPRWTWAARTLPYLGQEKLARLGGVPDGATNSEGAKKLLATDLAAMTCPSDPTNPRVRKGVQHLEELPAAVTSYKGVAGANWGADFFPDEVDFETAWRNRGTNGSFGGKERGDGLFWRGDVRGGKLTLKSITDGAGNTFMIGEDVAAMNLLNAWAYTNGTTGTCAIPLNVGEKLHRPDGVDVSPTHWENVYSFRSLHPGGANFAMADGSVRFVRDDIRLGTYRALATAAGGDDDGR